MMKVLYASVCLLLSSLESTNAKATRASFNRLNARSNGSSAPNWVPQNPLLPVPDPTVPYIYTHGDLDPASAPDFPPEGYISYGLDMTQTSTLDMDNASV